MCGEAGSAHEDKGTFRGGNSIGSSRGEAADSKMPQELTRRKDGDAEVLQEGEVRSVSRDEDGRSRGEGHFRERKVGRIRVFPARQERGGHLPSVQAKVIKQRPDVPGVEREGFSCQDLLVLGEDPVVEGYLDDVGQDEIDYTRGCAVWVDQAGDKDVRVDDHEQGELRFPPRPGGTDGLVDLNGRQLVKPSSSGFTAHL